MTETASSAEATASHNSQCAEVCRAALVVTDMNSLVTAIADATAPKVQDSKSLRIGFECPLDNAASHEAELTKLPEDLKLANRSSKTITNYTRTVRGLLSRCNKNVRDLTVNDLREYQLFLHDEDYVNGTIRSARSALNYFFGETLGAGEISVRLPPMKKRGRFHPSLNVLRLLNCSRNAQISETRHSSSWLTESGLRVSELVPPRIGAIDSSRMRIRAINGKRGEDRYTIQNGFFGNI